MFLGLRFRTFILLFILFISTLVITNYIALCKYNLNDMLYKFHLIIITFVLWSYFKSHLVRNRVFLRIA